MGRGRGGVLKTITSNGSSAGDRAFITETSKRIKSIIDEVLKKDFTTRDQAFAIGDIDPRILAFAKLEGLPLESGDEYSGKMYFSGKELNHAYRKEKREKGICANTYVTALFPMKFKSMDLYWDGEAFIYTDYRNKYILKPNYELTFKMKGENGKIKKKTRIINLTSASKVTQTNEFDLKKYRKL